MIWAGRWKPVCRCATPSGREKSRDPPCTSRGPFLQHAPYPGTELFRWGISGPADARAKVRKLAQAGVDCIKLIDQDQMTVEEVQAIVDEAHQHRLTVVAHAHRPDEIRRGLQAGVDIFEHTGLATAPEYPADIMIRSRTARSNIGPLFWTPTIEGLFNYEYIRRQPREARRPLLARRPARIDHQRPPRVHPASRALAYFQMTPSRRPTLARKFQQLRESGVILLIGADSGIPMKFHSHSTWNELDIWVSKLAVGPMDAIRAATYWPAVAMKVDKNYGAIGEGKYADIIAVCGDVLRYINLRQNVNIVIKHGRRYR